MQEKIWAEDVIRRAENFRWNTEGLYREMRRNAFRDLESLHDCIIEYCKAEDFQGLTDKKRIQEVLDRIFRTIKRTEDETRFCFDIAPEMVSVCMFMALCNFLHTSKKLPGMTIREFVRKNSSLDFANSSSPNHKLIYLLDSETEQFRKARLRLLKRGKVFLTNTKWNAITKDAEYEWKFFYDLKKESDDVQDFFKRLDNLYKGLPQAIESEHDEDYNDRVQKAYKKFRSKLEKLDYKKYLALQQVVWKRVCAEAKKEYYGMNLYRQEKRMRPYQIIHEVQKLEACRTEDEEAEMLLKTVFLSEICFPAIYERLFPLPLEVICQCANFFIQLLSEFMVESNLILDELIEQGAFGDEWEKHFREISNELAETVLYDPQSVDFSTTEKSQQKYHRLLHAKVQVEIFGECGRMLEPDDLLI